MGNLCFIEMKMASQNSYVNKSNKASLTLSFLYDLLLLHLSKLQLSDMFTRKCQVKFMFVTVKMEYEIKCDLSSFASTKSQ